MGYEGHGDWPRFGHWEDDDQTLFKLDDRMRGSTGVTPSDKYCVPETISIKIANGVPRRVKCALYGPTELDTESPFNWSLVAESEEMVISNTGGLRWYTFYMTTNPILELGKHYLIVAWSENEILEGTCGMAFKEVTVGNTYGSAIAYNGFPNPCHTFAFGVITSHIYCTYSLVEPTDCMNPYGKDGVIICGDPQYGQDPTHQYECQNGVWVDLGYNPICVTECIDPSGNEGDIICGNSAYGQDPTHQYECQNGVWVDLGYSPDCIVGCINPSGNEGDIICGNAAYGQDQTHQYQCVEGVWVDLGYDPACVVEPEIPWIPIVGAAVVVAGVIALYLWKR